MKGMEETKIEVPVVFVDAHANHPKWSKYYKDELENDIFSEEAATLA